MNNEDRAGFILTILIVLALSHCVINAQKAFSEDIPKFDHWQVSVQADGYPKLRYIHLASQTSFAFTYNASVDCADLKLEVRRFMEKDVYIPMGVMYEGSFAVGGRRFDFEPQIPEQAIAASLKVIQGTWSPDYAFFSKLIAADQLVWRDSFSGKDVTTISLEGFLPLLTVAMDICHEQYTEDKFGPQIKLKKRPLYSQAAY